MGLASGFRGCARSPAQDVAPSAPLPLTPRPGRSPPRHRRWALGHAGFAFPLLLTCCHAAFGFLAMAPLVLLLGRWQPYMDTLQRQWRGILVVRLATIGVCSAAAWPRMLIHEPYAMLAVLSSQPAATPAWPAEAELGTDRRTVQVGLCLAANIAFNNLSLVYISLSLNQVIRCARPGRGWL